MTEDVSQALAQCHVSLTIATDEIERLLRSPASTSAIELAESAVEILTVLRGTMATLEKIKEPS